MRLVVVAVALALAGAGFATAQAWDGDPEALPVPATAASRQTEASLGLMARLPVERLQPQAALDSLGVRVSASVVKRGTGESLLWELRWEPGAAWGAGTWVAFRDGLGRLREVRLIVLEGSDAADHRLAQPGTWIRFVPQGRNTRLDLFLAGRLVSGGWSVPATLLDLLQASDAWVWDQVGNHLDLPALLPQRRWEDEKVEALQARLHKLLSAVPVARTTLWWPDPASSWSGTSASGAPWGSWTGLPTGGEGAAGAPAERGLGAWGVSLWTATGVLRGWKAPFPTWPSLVVPRVQLPGYSRALVPEDLTTDPGFALDWIRNLGLAVARTLAPNRPQTDRSADVARLPYLEAVDDAGFSADDAPALVHLLAVTKPGTVYLASLSVQKAEKGAASAVTFQEPAVLLPWIGPDNRVKAAVYAGPREQTLAEWLGASGPRRGVRPDHLVLTALPLPPTVELPLLPAR